MWFFNYTLAVLLFLALIVMVWLVRRLNQSTGQLDAEVLSLRKWQQEHQPIERWASFLEHSISGLSFGLVLVDAQRDISYINDSAEKSLDIQFNKLKGQNYLSSLPFMDMDGQPLQAHHDVLMEVFQERTARNQTHYQIKSGESLHPIDVAWLPVYNDAGEIMGAAIVFQDTARQKQLEEMKVDFVSIVSHELRTPITAIKGYIDILLHETQLDPEHAEMLHRVYQSNERQLETVESMLNLSRLERGTIAIHQQDIHLEELVGQVVGEIEPLAKQKNLEIKFDYPRFALPTVWADPARTREVLLNLCTNGIKYSDKGTVKIVLKQDQHFMQVAVTDTGPGIPEEVQAKLFAKFQRGESALTEQKQGMGLGLYISRQFVELMGGKIWCESKPNQGTTFFFTLPLK